MTQLTLCEFLGTRSNEATDAANRRRDKCETFQEANSVCMKSYNEGKAIGYLEAEKLVKAELQRLRNLWQNNALTFDSFGVY